METEIDLMINYPKPKRNVDERGATKTEEDRLLARKFGKDFFDGDRKNGYGGFSYFSRFWQPVIPTFQKHWNLDSTSSVLDVGCAKGFMMHDFAELIPGITVKGIDISEYAIENAIEDMKPHVQVGNALSLPFDDKSFDVIISVTTLHNLEREECAIALQEIERVGKSKFICVESYRNVKEQFNLQCWALTAETLIDKDSWKWLFKNSGYSGDYEFIYFE